MWTKIKKRINNKKNQNLSTKIYCVIEKALISVVDENYEDTDRLYEAIEKIFNEFRDNGDTLESVKCGLRILCSDASVQRCENFLEKFYEGIRENDDLYKAVNMIFQQKGIRISQEEFRKLNEKIDNLTEIAGNKNDNEKHLQNKELVKGGLQEKSCVEQTNNHNKNIEYNIKKNVPSKKVSLKTILILTASAFIMLYLMANIIYEENTSNANYSKKNGEYLQAAEYYHDALVVSKVLIFNKISSEEVECMEADCYFLRALKEKDDDIALKYYAKAGGIYGKIINNEKSKGTEVYIDALTGLSHVYYFTEHKMDEEWRMVVKQIYEEIDNREKEYESIQNNDDINDILLYRWMRIYSALGDYYYTAIKTDYSFMYNPNITNTALECYEKYGVLLDLARKKDKEVETLINPILYDRIKAELMIFTALSPGTKNPEQYAKQAIDICQSYLNDASNNIGENTESYISFKSLIASAYRVLGEFNDKKGLKEESDKYMKKAYEKLIDVLNLENDKIELEERVDAGYSAIFTGLCSDKDLEKILDNYDKLISKYNLSLNLKESAWFALNICDACMGIINIYGHSERAWKMGREVTENVKSIEEYIQNSQKEKFDVFYDYFH